MGRITAQAVVQDACAKLIDKASNRRQFHELRDAAQSLHDNIGAYLQDHRPLPKPPPLQDLQIQAPLRPSQPRSEASSDAPMATRQLDTTDASEDDSGAARPAALTSADADTLAAETAGLTLGSGPQSMRSEPRGAASGSEQGPAEASPRVEAGLDDSYTGNAGLLGWQASTGDVPAHADGDADEEGAADGVPGRDALQQNQVDAQGADAAKRAQAEVDSVSDSSDVEEAAAGLDSVARDSSSGAEHADASTSSEQGADDSDEDSTSTDSRPHSDADGGSDRGSNPGRAHPGPVAEGWEAHTQCPEVALAVPRGPRHVRGAGPVAEGAEADGVANGAHAEPLFAAVANGAAKGDRHDDNGASRGHDDAPDKAGADGEHTDAAEHLRGGTRDVPSPAGTEDEDGASGHLAGSGPPPEAADAPPNLQHSMVEDYVPDAAAEEDEAGESRVFADGEDVATGDGSAAADAGPAVAPVATTVDSRLVEDYVASPPVASTVEPMTERAAAETVAVLRFACATGKVPFIVIALGTLERLIARGFLRGEVVSLMAEGEGRGGGGGDGGGGGTRGLSAHPTRLPVLAQALHLVCCCEDFGQEEEVEVAVLRAMLTVVSATTVRVHYLVLLLVIRACYNTFIMSRSDTTQQTAKAVLTQIVHIVFQRLLTGNPDAPVRPIALPDLAAVGIRAEARREVLAAQNVVMSVWQSLVQPDADASAALRTDGAFQPPPEPEARSEVSTRTAGESEGAHAAEPGVSGVHEGDGVATAAADATAPRSASPPRGAPLAFPSPSVSVAGSEVTGAAAPAAAAGADGDGDGARQLECAQKVMRAMCKLAMLMSNVPGDTSVTSGRALAMELLAGLLLNHGGHFQRFPKLMAVVKGELGNCLLANSKSSSPLLQRLTCHLFVLVLKTFREELKTKVAYLFRHTILTGLQPSGKDGGRAVDLDYRFVVFACLDPICADGQLLMDLFVNFDCDPDRTDTVLLERLFKLLCSCVTNPDALAEGGPGGRPELPPPQRATLRYAALKCLCQALRALYDWHEQLSGINALEAHPGSIAAIDDEAKIRVRSKADADASQDKGAALAGKQAKKKMRADGISLFNEKPTKGVAQLQAQGLLSTEPAEVAHWLRQTEGLDFAAVGEYLSDPSDKAKAVMHSYVDALDFTGLPFDDAIRLFLLDFRLPGEAQKIDRLMEKFAERYHVCNASREDYPFANAGTAYVLSYSVIMLNTDQHNPTVKRRMTVDDFVRNNRGIDDERDLPRPFLEDLFTRIRDRQIMMRHTMIEAPGDGGDSAAGEGEGRYLLDLSLMAGIFALFGRTKELRPEPTEGQIAQLEDFLKEKTQGLTFYSSQHPDELRPLVQTVWEFLLPTLATTFSEGGADPLLWQECLQGLVEAACLTCSLGLAFLASAFVRTLANFTSLHEPQNMRLANAGALRQLLGLPDQVGSHLHENWVLILRCLSRWAFVAQVASGSPTDLSLFATVDPDQKQEMKRSWWMGGRKQAGKAEAPPAPMQPGTLLDAGMALSSEFLSNRLPPQNVLDAIDDDACSRVFVSSVHLDPEAIVEFFHALTAVSLEELAGTPTARVFALSKIVDVCHHNINRPRIVWTSIWKGLQAADGAGGARPWQGLSEYFVDIGCHANLQVAMYSMDALRQIAEKFLERPELASMSFQNDFLKPFVVVMRQSEAKEIRELIVRQVSRMVLLQAPNVKSGWKSMFMVFSQAAKDNECTIVRLSFDTVEKIVREHFTVITETDVGVFADCVNCLTAFTNQSHDDNVALNAIAFLRFCAMRLAEGTIGDVDTLPDQVDFAPQSIEVTRIRPASHDDADGHGDPLAAEGSTSSRAASIGSAAGLGAAGPVVSAAGRRFSDHDEHLYFWMPLLIGLTELTFDPREAIRISALDVLFGILNEHGACYSEGFWAKVFERMLLPIFDSVQVDDVDFASLTARASDEASRDRWLYETCSHCLHRLIDLIVKFYPLVAKQLPKVLVKIKAFMLRTHHSLACVGVTAMERLISRSAAQMAPDMWSKVMAGLFEVAGATRPDVRKLLEYPPERYYRGHIEEAEAGTRSAYTLADGLGSRRLQQVRVRAHVQSLLVQSCVAIFDKADPYIPDEALGTLLATITRVCDHARAVSNDHETRVMLARWQAEDGIAPRSGLPDPPLLQLEIEAAAAEMSALRRLAAAEGERADRRREGSDVARRLFEACRANMERFEGAAPAGPYAERQASEAGASQDLRDSTRLDDSVHSRDAAASEQAALTPVLVETLAALRSIPQESFKQHLKDLFPVLTRLIRCRSASVEMQVALSDLFAAKVGPLM